MVVSVDSVYIADRRQTFSGQGSSPIATPCQDAGTKAI